MSTVKKKNLRGDAYDIPVDQIALAEMLSSDIQSLRSDMEDMKEDMEEMKKEDGEEYVDGEAEGKMDAMGGRLDALEGKLDMMGGALDKIVEMLASVGGEMLEDAGEAEREDRADAIAKMSEEQLREFASKAEQRRMDWMRERVQLERHAKSYKIDAFEGMSDHDLRVAVAAKITGKEIKADSVSADYLRGVIDLAPKVRTDEDDAYLSIGAAGLQQRNDGDGMSARERYLNRGNN